MAFESSPLKLLKRFRVSRVLITRPSVEGLLLASCVFFTLVYNLPFWRSIIAYQSPITTEGLVNLSLIGVAVTSLQALLLLPLVSRLTIKPLLVLLYLIGASAAYYSWYYSAYFDVSMINNIIETDYRESRELLTVHYFLSILVLIAVPVVWIFSADIPHLTFWTTVKRRFKLFLSLLALLLISLLLSFQTFSALMRNHKELRYLINPGNVLVSLPRALATKAEIAGKDKLPIGLDATLLTDRNNTKPRLVVLVIGETQRAANWGLNGYERNTTPRLAQHEDLISFRDVSSCGTSTAVSLPCMFSGEAHNDYSDGYARSHESLLNLVKRAGADVEWVDNQSGCKGVCDGIETDMISATRFPVECADDSCMDGVISEDLKEELAENDGNQLLVFHMMGSHGPAYYRRYPEQFQHFTPTCDTEELSQCTREEIVNSYDNSILYTDLVLSAMIKELQKDTIHESVLIYVSDHGESLGEMGVYLHGLPYMIAPEEQKKVPMVWWISSDFQESSGITNTCMQDVAQRAASHDNLFHTIIGLLDIHTEVYNQALDLGYPCRSKQ